jgi:hypothetical protein
MRVVKFQQEVTKKKKYRNAQKCGHHAYYPVYHLKRSKMLLLLTSRLLLPPGSALVQSIKFLFSTPSMLILTIAPTNAESHKPLLAAKVEKGIAVRGFCAIFLSDSRVNGALPLLVSE